MSRLKLPAAAAAFVAVAAVGGRSAPRAIADAGDPGTSSAAAAPVAGTPADGLTDSGTGTGTDAGTGLGTDAGAGTDLGAGTGDPAAGADSATDPLTDPSADPSLGAGAGTGSDAGGTGSATDPTATLSGGGGAMNVSPTTVAPGGMVTLHLQTSCSAGHKAKATASVFVSSVTLAPASSGGSGLEGSAFIRSDAVDGSYTVSVQCDGESASATATVTVTTSTQPLTPVRPVPAGGGGTAQLAAGPTEAGSSTGALLAGGGFAAAALTTAVVRRRRAARTVARG
jgi:hypothetical protein